MKILIVDDAAVNLYILEMLLTGSGYEVVSAEDGLEALAASAGRGVRHDHLRHPDAADGRFSIVPRVQE